ncbi:MAG: hypothetical protein HXY26_03250 [Hydrogenophilaceae bacterium]|nr:hypothetical protein [Hydrogenophilaceae bacterium]
MAQLPAAAEQILRVHAQFIHAVVQAMVNPALKAELQGALQAAEAQGWGQLVATIRQIAAGKRDRQVLLGLDDEDRVIAEAILAGLNDPATLPPLDSAPEAGAAAPGLAAMIEAAARGDVQAFSALATMAEQMVKAGGDMARLGGIMRRLIDGERDADLLTRGMGGLGRELVLDILDQLAKQTTH